MAHTCDECGRDDFRTVSGLASHQRAKHPPKVEGNIYGQTLQAVESARHLTPMDDGTVAVLLDLARVIDGMPERDRDAPMDNVTKPTYLKYATELGLTPLSRLKLGKSEDRSGSKLAELRSIRGGRAS